MVIVGSFANVFFCAFPERFESFHLNCGSRCLFFLSFVSNFDESGKEELEKRKLSGEGLRPKAFGCH